MIRLSNSRGRIFLGALLYTAYGFMLPTANAGLVSQDLFGLGDGYLTYDSATGLSWLDVPLTLNQSYNEVLSGYGGYTTTLGFRYATKDEVGVLFSDAGVTQGNIWGFWDFSNPYYLSSVTLVSLLGVTYPYDGLSTGTFGLTGSQSAPSSYLVAQDTYNNHADSIAFSSAWTMNNSDSLPYVGSFLVRGGSGSGSGSGSGGGSGSGSGSGGGSGGGSGSPTIPEPATLALFGIGLAGLGFTRRRKAS